MPNIDLSILNQRQTPAFFADTLANRPAAGFLGRIFVSTDTFAFYRDNGTGWDLIGGPGTGTITGSGAAGQVSFWNGASTITGSNDLFWDSVNGHLGIGTNTPGTALGINHDQNQVIQLNQTTATNDTKIAFQNSGTPLWRIGNSYNAGANDFAIYDNIGAIQQFTIKKTTGQTLIGGGSGGSGKLVVESGLGDNGIQIVSAIAPSLRIDNANTGPTKRIGIAIATAVNNFIQGAVDRDMCIFNGSTTASPILFGVYDAAAVNVQEAARVSAARNLLVGTSVDSGQKLIVSGTALITGASTFNSSLTANNFIASGGNNTTILNSSNATTGWVQVAMNNTTGSALIGIESSVAGTLSTGSTAYATIIRNYTNTDLQLATNNIVRQTITSAGNVGIGVTNPSLILHTSADGVAGQIQFDQYGTAGANILLRNARGTQSSPTATTGGDLLGSIGSRGYDGTNFSGGGRSGMYMYAAENFTPTNQGSFIVFGTTPIGAAARIERVRLNDNGNLLVNTSTDSGQKLQVNGAITSNQYVGNFVIGINYPQTSALTNTSIINTSINYNTNNIGYGTGALYQLSMLGNPNSGGSASYKNIKFGYIIVNTGYDGSNVKTYITYQEVVNGNSTGIGGFTISVVFWDGTTESSNIAPSSPNVQIRIKVDGYNSGVVGDYQEVRLTKISS